MMMLTKRSLSLLVSEGGDRYILCRVVGFDCLPLKFGRYLRKHVVIMGANEEGFARNLLDLRKTRRSVFFLYRYD